MENIFFDSFINSLIGKLYIPSGSSPFPTVIIIKQQEGENDENILTLYARKMNEFGYLAFTLISFAEKQTSILQEHLNIAIDYLTTRKEVDIKKIFLLIADLENTTNTNTIELFDERIQAITSLNWLPLQKNEF